MPRGRTSQEEGTGWHLGWVWGGGGTEFGVHGTVEAYGTRAQRRRGKQRGRRLASRREWSLLMEEEGRVRASLDGSVLKNPPAMQESQESLVQSLGQQNPPEEGMTTLLQYSCLGNPRDRRALQATVHRVAKSRTRLK